MADYSNRLDDQDDDDSIEQLRRFMCNGCDGCNGKLWNECHNYDEWHDREKYGTGE